LRMSFSELLEVNPSVQPYFCRFNSGAPRMTGGRRSPRGPDTFQKANEWRGPPFRVAEVSFVGRVVLPTASADLGGDYTNLSAPLLLQCTPHDLLYFADRITDPSCQSDAEHHRHRRTARTADRIP
jgi:hypothetical protein